MKIYFDSSPISNAHAIRGIGVHTRSLLSELQKIPDLKVITTPKIDLEEKNIDLTHYNYFNFFRPTLPFKHQGKSIVTIHDVIPLIFKDKYPAGIRGTINLMRQKLALKKVDHIITISYSAKQDIIEYLNQPANKISVSYLAANPNLKKPNEQVISKIKHKYKLPDDYLLYVGDINYNKNLPQLVKSLSYLPKKIHLVLVGKNFRSQEIPEWKWIQAQIEAERVKQRVHFVNNVLSEEYEDLSAIYSGSLCYVQPSLYEGFGLPVIEAMQCQTPVICTANSSLLEIGQSYVEYVKSTGEGIAKGVNNIIKLENDTYDVRIKKAYEYSQTFTWEKNAKQVYQIYQTIIKQ